MIPYKEFSPTQFDNHIYVEDKENWLVAPVSRTRDSGILEQSNFEKTLEALGNESKNVQVHRFGHWGPGWFEIILINPEAKELVKIAEEIENGLSDYPIVDDCDYYNREHEAKIEFIENELTKDLENEIDDYLYHEIDLGYSSFEHFSNNDLFEMLMAVGIYDKIEMDNDSSPYLPNNHEIANFIDWNLIKMIVTNESCIVEYHKQLSLPGF